MNNLYDILNGIIALQEATITKMKNLSGNVGGGGGSGYTPIRGVDYWTAADIQQIQNYINNHLPESIGTPVKGVDYWTAEDIQQIQTYIDQHVPASGVIQEILQTRTVDYTAVQVYPTSAVIPSGTVDDVTGLTYKNAVPACMEAVFKLRTICPTAQSDVIVDWGDENRTYIKDVDQSVVTQDRNEYNVIVRHTYTNSGRYIVKFFGTKYFGFGNPGVRSLVSRAFASDLPFAKHLNTTGNLAAYSDRLLKIDIPSYMLSEGLWNMNGMFISNSNLISATGLKYLQGDVRNSGNIFDNNISLETTDFVFPAYIRDGVLNSAFSVCNSLEKNISDLFPKQGFIGNGTYSVNYLFGNCSKLSGTVPAAKLWENTNITWTNTSTAFFGCSPEIRAQVPTSWGGTNTEIQAKLDSGYYNLVQKHVTDKIAQERNIDYTAFEVLPHTVQIPSGVISNTILANKVTDTTVLVSNLQNSIDANTVHRMKIRTNQENPLNSDIVIDWGDGTRSSVAAQEYESSSIDAVTKEGEYVFAHDYSQALTSENLTSKRYIIKIFGKQYYNITHRIDSSNTLLSNLMCRCFEADLPMASNFRNISNFCYGGHNLVFASFEAIKYNYFENAQGLFTSCKNLVKAIGFGAIFTTTTCGSFFSGCRSLKETDFVLPMNTLRNSSFAQTFYGCIKLNKDISTLFPKVWSIKGTESADSIFRWCSSLSGTIPANLLWANPDITWTNTTNCFVQCSETIRAQVPTSWGGTNTEIQAQIDSGSFDHNTVTTPIKGVDYWTEEDKQQIKEYVENAILNGEW